MANHEITVKVSDDQLRQLVDEIESNCDDVRVLNPLGLLKMMLQLEADSTAMFVDNMLQGGSNHLCDCYDDKQLKGLVKISK
jgi:hypothetical protein